jgi:hypothetical protein
MKGTLSISLPPPSLSLSLTHTHTHTHTHTQDSDLSYPLIPAFEEETEAKFKMGHICPLVIHNSFKSGKVSRLQPSQMRRRVPW